MGKKEQRDQKNIAKIEAVLELIRKQTPLTLKQEKFCNYACVQRFLKAKGDNVKKAAKQLRSCLSWRQSMGIENLMADEFSAEIADGLAYVAGHDDESRPVMIFRMKQDGNKSHSQKQFIRLLVFTLEVAISTMTRNVEQFVILFDVSFYRSASTFTNGIVGALKIVADYYPGRLHRAFLIDPPALFSYMWKGVRPFVELSTATMVVSSLDYEESLDFNDFTAYPRAASLQFYPSTVKSTARTGSCSSSRFSFTVSHHLDSLKPWYLSLGDTSASKVGPALVSPLNARSFSFGTPVARRPRGDIDGGRFARKSSLPSTPLSQRFTAGQATNRAHHRTPRPSFLQSPAVFFRRGSHVSKNDKSKESFLPFLKFYRRPYDEMIYRSKMKPPLGGLISIVSPHTGRRCVSVSQRF